MAINPDLGEQVGWPRFVETVTTAWRSIPPAERAHTAIFTANYGEAGAVDVLGGSLPRAYSGHNGFSEWGMPPRGATRTRSLLGYYGNGDQAPAFAAAAAWRGSTTASGSTTTSRAAASSSAGRPRRGRPSGRTLRHYN